MQSIRRSAETLISIVRHKGPRAWPHAHLSNHFRHDRVHLVGRQRLAAVAYQNVEDGESLRFGGIKCRTIGTRIRARDVSRSE